MRTVEALAVVLVAAMVISLLASYYDSRLTVDKLELEQALARARRQGANTFLLLGAGLSLATARGDSALMAIALILAGAAAINSSILIVQCACIQRRQVGPAARKNE